MNENINDTLPASVGTARGRVSRRTALRACAGAALGLLLAGQPVRAIAQAVSDAAGARASYRTLEFEWTDAARQREVPVRLYLPTSASADAPVPLVVFSHGIGGSRRGYSYLGQHFAANGIASLHVQHVGSDRALWTGNVFGMLGRLLAAAQEGEAIHRVRDLSFALDQLLAGEAGTRIDAKRLVVAGHSYGANTAMLAAGARVERNGQVLDLREPRFTAAILISAPPFYGESDTAQILRYVTIPTLHITATDDEIRIPGYYSGAADRIAVFEAMGSRDKTLAVFSGGSHSVFTDRMAPGGFELNQRVKAATRELSLAFRMPLFGGGAEPLDKWNQRYGEIVTRLVTAPLH